MNLSELKKTLLKLRKRAETADRSTLVETFVDIGPVFTLLSNPEHQIFYGRRGTGKTHALIYLAESQSSKGEIPVYLDLKNLGSSGGIYSNSEIPLTERSTRCLVDVLAGIHEVILQFAVEHSEEINLGVIGPLLDEFSAAITEVEVIGETTTEDVEQASNQWTTGSTIRGGMSLSDLNIGAETTESIEGSTGSERRVQRTGRARHRVHFGRVSGVLKRIIEFVSPKTVWLLLDEWSTVPIDIQPFLADLLRRSLFPLRGLVVKIAAIEQRTEFQLPGERGDYVGIELGADAAADVNLDDYMVFDNDEQRATEFFAQLIFKHVSALIPDETDSPPEDSQAFIQQVFTQITAFEEFVRASEGVPRDAMYLLAQAAQKDLASQISVDNVRTAARIWYQRDKENSVSANKAGRTLLHWIVDEVIGQRQARAFLLLSNTRHKLIDTLYDARVLHLLKRNISSRDEPGVRYDAYKLDYGCYVDLLTTTRAPQGMLFADDGDDWSVEVPRDDYRAIRRAILDLEAFESRHPEHDA